MVTAKTGDTVQVHYSGTLMDGTEFDSSRGRAPLEFELGGGTILPDFEAAVIGMRQGERKRITIPCESAFGEHETNLNLQVPRSALPADIDLTVGMVLQGKAPDGQTADFRVLEIEGDQVVMDGNHPLAGHDLIFDLELVGLN